MVQHRLRALARRRDGLMARDWDRGRRGVVTTQVFARAPNLVQEGFQKKTSKDRSLTTEAVTVEGSAEKESGACGKLTCSFFWYPTWESSGAFGLVWVAKCGPSQKAI